MEPSALHPYSNEIMKGTTYGNNVNRDGCRLLIASAGVWQVMAAEQTEDRPPNDN